MRKMPGVHYPDPVPPPGGPPPDRHVHNERSMALRFVRTAFDPPLPDPFADWLITLHRLVRDGASPDMNVTIPAAVSELGYTFVDSVAGGRGMALRDALRLFGRDDLAEPAPVAPAPYTAAPGEELNPTEGVIALAAALVAHGIRTTTAVHRLAGGCTVRLSGEQAQKLADLLIPAEGSVEDALGIALGLLDCMTQDRDLTCAFDHHGSCQEHGCRPYEGRCAQPQAHAFLICHGVREEA